MILFFERVPADFADLRGKLRGQAGTLFFSSVPSRFKICAGRISRKRGNADFPLKELLFTSETSSKIFASLRLCGKAEWISRASENARPPFRAIRAIRGF